VTPLFQRFSFFSSARDLSALKTVLESKVASAGTANVFDEEQGEDVVLVLAGNHAATQLIAH
jgi:hypothetical protein